MSGSEQSGGAGKRRIAAVARQAEQKLERQMLQSSIKWPKKGGKLNGVGPGEWRDGAVELDETGCLPADCPVKPLGRDGENYYFIDTAGEIFATGDKPLGVERMRKLFAGETDFLYWCWPAWSKGSKNAPPYVTGFKNDEAHEDLFAACLRKGSFSATDMVRGRGAWLDEAGQLILHCGETLWIGGEQKPTGQYGDYFYTRRPRTFLPWAEPVEADINPATEIFAALRTWNMVRGDVDALLLMGWIFVALLGGALQWRPSAFLVGDKGTGKSSLVGKGGLLRGILQRNLVATTNATEAGLYQLVGQDSVPIAIDEMEGADGQAQAAKIVKMARDAASGSTRIRGGADHKGVEFEARSAFLFSAINPPPLPPASLTRLAMIQLRPIDTAQRPPAIRDIATVGPRLLRRAADHFPQLATLKQAYGDVLRANGHDSRGQDTFGTLLAGAHLLLGDEGMDALGLPFESLDHWGVLLNVRHLHELTGQQANWSQCIESILTSQIDAFSRGERRTVGKILEDLAGAGDGDVLGFDKARDVLGNVGLGLVPRGLGGEGYALGVPHTGRDINRLLAGTDFAAPSGDYGSWSTALSQAPETIVKKQIAGKRGNRTNRMMIGAQRRCLFIDLAALKEWQDARETGEGEG